MPEGDRNTSFHVISTRNCVSRRVILGPSVCVYFSALFVYGPELVPLHLGPACRRSFSPLASLQTASWGGARAEVAPKQSPAIPTRRPNQESESVSGTRTLQKRRLAAVCWPHWPVVLVACQRNKAGPKLATCSNWPKLAPERPCARPSARASGADFANKYCPEGSV